MAANHDVAYIDNVDNIINNHQHLGTNMKCHIANIPKDILWYCIVSVYLEVNDVANMERAFTNKAFYTLLDNHGNRQGLFMDVDWDTSNVPVSICRGEQIDWLRARKIRIYSARCIDLRNAVIELLLRSSQPLLHSIDLSGCKEHVTTDTLRLLSEICGSSLHNVVLNGCDIVSDISALTSKCRAIKHLNLNSMYRLTDADCIIMKRDLPKLEVLDISYCDKVTNTGIDSLISIDNLSTLYMVRCPRANENALKQHRKPWPQLKRLSIARHHVNTSLMITLMLNCVNLEEINIYGCYGVDDSLLHGIANHCPKLQNLYMGDCGAYIADVDGCLAHIAKSCPLLQAINLAFIRFSDLTLRALGEHCHLLRDLDFSCCSAITDDGIVALVAGNRYIRDICLCRCSQVTDVSVGVLLTCTNLRRLDVQGCYHISKVAANLVAAKTTVKFLLTSTGTNVDDC